MRILFVISEGIGNVAQTVPLYLAIKEKHDVDVAYLKQYPTDNIESMRFFPSEELTEVMPWELDQISNDYDRVIQPPFGGNIDSFLETDSEFARNMKILDYLEIKKDIKRDFIMEQSQYKGDVVIHNGCQKGWERKLYPYWGDVVQILINQGLKVTSIGAAGEYIPGTHNATGHSIRKTVGTIFNHRAYLGTDTGTYHLAALMDKPGAVVFTATSREKNWDKDFHHTISKIHTWLPCQPCQQWYHFKPEYGECKQHLCQQVDPRIVAQTILHTL